MQRQEFCAAPVHFFHGDLCLIELIKEGLTKSRSKVQQGEKPGRVESAAVTESGTDDVIFVGREGLEYVQEIDRTVEHSKCSIHQLHSARMISLVDRRARAVEFVGRTLEQELRSLMHYLKHQFIRMRTLFG